jgi:predicted ATPase
MPSLTVPDQTRAPVSRASDVLDCEATKLFVERTLAVDNRFALSDDNASAIAEICRRLDGIPLAIELAAARIVMLSPQQLCDQLDERLRILNGGSRGVIARHQTLRALMDWSYNLLDDRECILFRRLGIFAHGYTLAAAVAVCDGDLSEGDVVVTLASLVDKSLALLQPAGDVPRYRLLESTRLYALEKLVLAAEHRSTAGRLLCHLRDRLEDLRAQADRTGPWSGIY